MSDLNDMLASLLAPTSWPSTEGDVSVHRLFLPPVSRSAAPPRTVLPRLPSLKLPEVPAPTLDDVPVDLDRLRADLAALSTYRFDLSHRLATLEDRYRRETAKLEAMQSHVDELTKELPDTLDEICGVLHARRKIAAGWLDEIARLTAKLDLLRIAPSDGVVDKYTCPVCYDHQVTVAVLPCGHMLCKMCDERVQPLTTCPVCRKTPVTTQTLYN